jgi:hypothetical protein
MGEPKLSRDAELHRSDGDPRLGSVVWERANTGQMLTILYMEEPIRSLGRIGGWVVVVKAKT